MKRSDCIKSSQPNFFKWFNKYSILILGFTSVSIVTSATIGLIKHCSPQIYSSKTTANTTSIKSTAPSFGLMWFYGAIIIGFSGTPWLLTHFLKQIATSSTKKAQRLSNVLPPTRMPLKPSLPLETNRVFATPSNLSYRISSRKKIASPLTCNELTFQPSTSSHSKNVTLPFNRTIQTKK